MKIFKYFEPCFEKKLICYFDPDPNLKYEKGLLKWKKLGTNLKWKKKKEENTNRI